MSLYYDYSNNNNNNNNNISCVVCAIIVDSHLISPQRQTLMYGSPLFHKGNLVATIIKISRCYHDVNFVVSFYLLVHFIQ